MAKEYKSYAILKKDRKYKGVIRCSVNPKHPILFETDKTYSTKNYACKRAEKAYKQV